MCIKFPAGSGAVPDALPSHDSNCYFNFSDSRGWDRFPSPRRGRLRSRLDKIPRAKSVDGDTWAIGAFPFVRCPIQLEMDFAWVPCEDRYGAKRLR
jgi:hypothetical protein